MSETSAIRPNCRACGLPINDPSWVTWNGVTFHMKHIPSYEPQKSLEDYTEAELRDELHRRLRVHLGSDRGSFTVTNGR